MKKDDEDEYDDDDDDDDDDEVDDAIQRVYPYYTSMTDAERVAARMRRSQKRVRKVEEERLEHEKNKEKATTRHSTRGAAAQPSLAVRHGVLTKVLRFNVCRLR